MARKMLLTTIFIACSISVLHKSACCEEKVSQKSETDWDEFEKRQYQKLVGKVLQNPGKQSALEISESQTDVLNSLNADRIKRLQKIAIDRSELFSLVKQRAIDRKEFKRHLARLDQELDRVHQEAARLAEKTLLKNQLQLIRKMAKRSRLLHEGSSGDEFGIALAIAKQTDISTDELKKFEQAVKEARQDYYRNVRKERTKSNKAVLGSLSATKRKEFVKQFGSLYDYFSESVKDVTFFD